LPIKYGGYEKRHALLVDSDRDLRLTISRYLQLHGVDVVEVDSIREAQAHLSGEKNFDLLVTALVTPKHAHWREWKTMLASRSNLSLLLHGHRLEDWRNVSNEIGRQAGFIPRPFTLSDFHWALHQVDCKPSRAAAWAMKSLCY
jgi:DNA-binding NtrC family response regulator